MSRPAHVNAHTMACCATPTLLQSHCNACTGPLPIDKEVYSQLMATGQFEQMALDVDEVGRV
jgi:hypothetical protein